MLKQKLLFTALAIVLLPTVVRSVNAETFVILGNGSGSDNDINVTSSNTTSVNQTNTASVNNDVDIEADTGDNTASGNTGENTSIDTGDIQASTAIENNLNTSVAKVEGCSCDSTDSVEISENGVYADNNINHSTSQTNSVTVNQQANISNNLNGKAVTGGNSANYNNGDVSIQTGNISVNESIKNNTNYSSVMVSARGKGVYDISIKGNSAYSDNTITLHENTANIVSITDVSSILNNSFWDLITGNNKANGNTGDIAIKTGDIDLDILIENYANKNKVAIDCDCENDKESPEGENPEEEKPEEENPEEPEEEKSEQPAVVGGNGGKGGDHKDDDEEKGEVLAAAIGDILPITGTPWFLLAILGNILMLLYGTVLRLRSGRSPGLAYAI